MSSQYADLDRPPLSAASLTGGLVHPGSLWREIRVVEETASTNADLAAAAAGGAAEGLVLVAENQVGGRGRLGRSWASPPRAGITGSVLLRPGPDVPTTRWGWLPLLMGTSVRAAVARLGEVEARLKWPNDLLLGPDRRKAAGILAEVVDGAVVIGVGLNVTTRAAELPGPQATSLALERAACTDRDPLLRAILRQLADDLARWRAAGGDSGASGLQAAYTEACDTLGREVRVELPGRDDPVTGIAEAVDSDGRLVLRVGDTTSAVAAGDVVHVRPI